MSDVTGLEHLGHGRVELLPAADFFETAQQVLRPRAPYPFPWPLLRFFDAMPETVLLDPPALEPVAAEGEFDLVIVAYQVWFLSPSGPITAFLKSEAGRRLLRGRPVVTVIGCRNMWLNAQETVKRLVQDAGGELRDNVVFTDDAPTLATLVTTLLIGLAPAVQSTRDLRGAIGQGANGAVGPRRRRTRRSRQRAHGP